jgi:hypothetical protein
MLRRVALVRTDVSEELSASIIRVTRIGELGTLAVTSNRRRLRYFFAACGFDKDGEAMDRRGSTGVVVMYRRYKLLDLTRLLNGAVLRNAALCSSRNHHRQYVSRALAETESVRKGKQ